MIPFSASGAYGHGAWGRPDPGGASTAGNGAAPGVTVLIEPRALIRDCISLSLATLDPASAIESYPDIDMWARDGQVLHASLLLCCSIAAPGEALADTLWPLISAMREIAPDLPFAIFASHDDPMHASEAIRLGARGYLSPEVSLEVTVHALKLIRAGGIYVPANLLGTGRRHDPPGLSDQQMLNLFSPRELEVARAMRKGQPNKIIALELGMSESTVKVHVRNIIKKLKVKNRTEVAFRTRGLFVDGG